MTPVIEKRVEKLPEIHLDAGGPGAHPAATAIGWSLPAQVIGEREKPLAKATRERIRRGLERLAKEPFAIRLLQGGNPRPLTLPLVTLTARHDMAMVMPVAGNTFERTPGNRARDPDRQPLDTVHATLDRALVMRTGHKSANGHLTRDAETEPGLTQTTHSESAVVLSGTQNDTGRDPETEPVQVQVCNRAPRIVFSNRANNIPRSLVIPYDRTGQPAPAESEPTPTLTTRDRLAMVVPYTRNGRARDAERDVNAAITSEGAPAVVLTEDDIDACRFRMFELAEIARAMAMQDHPDGSEYQVLGNKRERMAQYGNAVTPPAMRALLERCLEVLT